MFVKRNETGKYIELTYEEAIGCQEWGAKVFELIPVEEK
jgi:hypothetical protein